MRVGSKEKIQNFFGSTVEAEEANPFFRRGDEDAVSERWVAEREEMTDDYRKRYRAAKRRRGGNKDGFAPR